MAKDQGKSIVAQAEVKQSIVNVPASFKAARTPAEMRARVEHVTKGEGRSAENIAGIVACLFALYHDPTNNGKATRRTLRDDLSFKISRYEGGGGGKGAALHDALKFAETFGK